MTNVFFNTAVLLLLLLVKLFYMPTYTGPRSAVGNVLGNRCESDCKHRGRKLDPSPVPNFRGE